MRDNVYTKHTKNMTSLPAELTVLCAFLFAGKKTIVIQFFNTGLSLRAPLGAHVHMCADNCMGVCRGAVMLS